MHSRPNRAHTVARRDAVLAGAGLGDDAALAQPPGEQRLADGVVDLVRAGVVQILALQPDPRAATSARISALGQVERRRPADVVAAEARRRSAGKAGSACAASPAASTARRGRPSPSRARTGRRTRRTGRGRRASRVPSCRLLRVLTNARTSVVVLDARAPPRRRARVSTPQGRAARDRLARRCRGRARRPAARGGRTAAARAQWSRSASAPGRDPRARSSSTGTPSGSPSGGAPRKPRIDAARPRRRRRRPAPGRSRRRGRPARIPTNTPTVRTPAGARVPARRARSRVDAARAVGDAGRSRPGRRRPRRPRRRPRPRVRPQILTSVIAAPPPARRAARARASATLPTSTASAPASRAASTSARDAMPDSAIRSDALRAALASSSSWPSRSTSSVSRSRALTPIIGGPERERALDLGGACAPRPARPCRAAPAVWISRRASSSLTMPRITSIGVGAGDPLPRHLLGEDGEVLGQRRQIEIARAGGRRSAGEPPKSRSAHSTEIAAAPPSS